MNNIEKIKNELKDVSDPNKALILQKFFKTGVGEYGEGDIFIGASVGDSRKIAKKYKDIPLSEVSELLSSKIHEERLIALVILTIKYSVVNDDGRGRIVDFYLRHTKYINNWDLVDISAHKILGSYLYPKGLSGLMDLARSDSLWERRISIIATYYFIKENHFDATLSIALLLLNDKHDLIHKAVGWMLREVGKRSYKTEKDFLIKHYKKIPRTMLRYAIERFRDSERQAFLKGKA